jgi:hypothetical protein
MRVLLLLLALAAPALAGDLPDAALTPGLANPALTRDVLCAKGFTTRNVRNVPAVEKREVYARYGIACGRACGKQYEVDHLIPLTIGGSNDVTNLWPQSYRGEWSAHVKDRLENRLRHLVCSGMIELEKAQREISTDWIGMYRVWICK